LTLADKYSIINKMESKDIDMTDERLLLDYTRFVDEVTSEESKDPQAFSDALDIIDETSGLPPERLITAALGITAEGGEFAEIIKKACFQGKPLDDDAQYHMKRELGDVMWYIAQACIALDCTLEDIIYMNIEKLEARYPDGFDSFRSNNRKEGDV
jgi:NTP pyrophosphatase (non-canonical NTP hydrolase)|tara:strand:- start:664 stop:1131 length:468 start_codon:yes stop_codon:yes gene_type:complete